MNLKELSPWKKLKYAKGETFYRLIGQPLLTDGRGHMCEQRRVSPSATIQMIGPFITLKLFDTDVAKFQKGGGMVLNSGGWRTRFTRQAVDSLLPNSLALSQVSGLWWLTGRHFEGGFQDGCVVHEDGSVEHAMTKAQWKERVDLVAKSKRFIHRYVDHLLDGKVPPPGLGDCLYCKVETGTSKASIGVLLPDGTERPHTSEELGDHVRSHVDEGYFVPSMLWNAINEQGGPEFLGWAGRESLQWLWSQERKNSPGSHVTAELFERDRARAGMQLRKVLSSYVKRRIGCEFSGRGWQSRSK